MEKERPALNAKSLKVMSEDVISNLQALVDVSTPIYGV